MVMMMTTTTTALPVAIVCLDTNTDRRRFMLHAFDRGMATSEYVYILPDYLPDVNMSKIWLDQRPKEERDGRDADSRKAFEAAIVVGN